jgi:hypothetical protein
MTQPVLFHVGTALQNIGLALVLGGILTIGAFVAPVLFKQFPREAAGAAMTIVFKRYDIVLLVSVGLILLGETLRVMTTGWPKMGIFTGLRMGLMVLMMGILLYSALKITPQMSAMQAEGLTTPQAMFQFGQLHQLIEKLYKIAVVFAAVLLGMASYAPPGLR